MKYSIDKLNCAQDLDAGHILCQREGRPHTRHPRCELISEDTSLGRDSLFQQVRVQGRANKTMLSSVTHVASGLMGCASAALGYWVGGKREIQTCKNFFAPLLYKYTYLTYPLLVTE